MVGVVVEPIARIVRIYSWTGTPHRQLYPVVLDLVRTIWRCRNVVVDATGVGGGLAAFLGAALGPRIVLPFLYTAKARSELAYDLLAAVNSHRLLVYAEASVCPGPDGSREGGDAEANAERRELLHQASAAQYELRAHQQMTFHVPESRGHDDHLNAAALLTQAVKIGALRQVVGRSGRHARHGAFGDDRPSRR